jgi:hypothetical protein
MYRFDVSISSAVRTDDGADAAPPGPDAALPPALLADCGERFAETSAYARRHFEDEPLVRDWVWTG